jgi:hypothetical protein
MGQHLLLAKTEHLDRDRAVAIGIAGSRPSGRPLFRNAIVRGCAAQRNRDAEFAQEKPPSSTCLSSLGQPVLPTGVRMSL